ncbi:thioredoxin domain-containing protein 9 [Phymastichus coffea]|uniref:thioredoxin domain-containing protein 9 n=1 Tax=Phymastichus coffea TaxID=108790 RepID=UPI00273B03B8|nr:thioredoxin domain-containing protein 9 [Phymastichus coffea]XP_058789487.1 thioredoxin domain-containing protein 9 [Phymastichus coffea]XP_058789488.1 thioredoxin domain-containing protein 9 [Phymastichus coffea]
MDQVIQQKVAEIASHVEKQLDAEIEKLDNLNIDDIEKLREHRLKEMKKMQQQKQIWLSQGHGEYTELSDEKEFFEVCKKSDKVVCHFYKDGTERCKIVDMHLKILCKKHIETRFIKLNVEKCPFLTGRLKIRVIPTIGLVVDSKTKDYIVGFTDLGNCDDFSTEVLEWRIAHGGAINYNGDLMHPPDNTKIQKQSVTRKTIREKYSDDSDIDSD